MSAATQLIDGNQTIAAAGTRVRLAEQATTTIKSIIVQALSNNTGVVVVGGSDVVAAVGAHGAPTQKGIALTAGQSVAIDTDDVADVYLDATVSGDGVAWLALQYQ